MTVKQPTASLLVLLTAASCLWSVPLQAQLFDRDYYRPDRTDPDERVSLYGSQHEQRLGQALRNIGPTKEGEGSRILLQGMPGNIPFLTAIESSPSFNISAPKVLQMSNLPWDTYFARGHFRSAHTVDLLVEGTHGYMIYWGDEDGNFDSARYTILRPERDSAVSYSSGMDPYVAYLTSDSLHDIVLIFDKFYKNNRDELEGGRAYLFKGGPDLYRPWGAAIATEIEKIGSRLDIDYVRIRSQGDWRGAGRDDWIGINSNGDGFHYLNDPPFSLKRFAEAVRFDTLWAAWESDEPLLRSELSFRLNNSFSMQAMPKASWDKSVDFMPRFPRNDYKGYGIWIFRGGPNFGSKRLDIDSPDFHIPAPSNVDPGFAATYISNLRDCGDMTGRGHRILHVGCYGLSDGANLFYATGRALDTLVDMFIPGFGNRSSGIADTITANKDGLQDVIIGRPGYVSDQDYDLGKRGVGMLEIVYGSAQIPTKINPAMSVGRTQQASSKLEMHPNPVAQYTTISIPSGVQSISQLVVRNILGHEVFRQQISAIGEDTLEWQRPPGLPAGSYLLSIESIEAQSTALMILL